MAKIIMADLESLYRDANKRYAEDEAFREKVSVAMAVLQGTALENPKVIEHLEFIRDITLAHLLLEYWRPGIKVPYDAFVGQGCFAGLRPVSERRIICAIVALKRASGTEFPLTIEPQG